MNLRYFELLALRRNTFRLFFTFIFLANLHSYAQLAFPTAKGAGAYVTGGRGGQVIHVTTLDATGPGSFVEAMRTEGPRTIVFDVGGTIDLTTAGITHLVDGNQNTDFHNVTVAGQTAPGGITIEASGLYMDFISNAIFRYVRFKGKDIPFGADMVGHAQSNSIVYDHCSILYGNDECLSIWDDTTPSYGGIGVGNVTVQHCLMGESKTGMIVGGGEANGVSNVSILNNAFVSISHRFPNPKDPFGGQLDVINNIVYNWKERLVVLNFSGTNDPAPGNIDINNIGNTYKASSLTVNDWGLGAFTSRVNKIMLSDVDPSEARIYTAYNKIPGYEYTNPPILNDNALWTTFWESDPLPHTDWFTTTQFPLLGQGFPIKSADQAWNDVLADVGANAYLSDSHVKVNYSEAADNKMITEALNDSATQWPGHNSETHIHGTHSGSTRPANWDTDLDGMPDSWEISTFGDLSKNGTADTDGDGFTDLEEYLNLIDGEVVTIDVTGVTVTPSEATINFPDTLTLNATVQPADASNPTGVWSSSNDAIAIVDNNGVVTSVGEGQAIITFNTNSGGFSDSATITVTNIPISVESVSLSPETLDLNINITETLSVNISPVNATDQTGVWSSSDPAIATVDQEGLLQPISVGQVVISFTTNDGGFTASSQVTVNDDNFGRYEFYNADSDSLIQEVDGGEVFDLDNIGENLNFRAIPYGGDGNPDVESVKVNWTGVESGTHSENVPIYAGLTGHLGNDFEPYTVSEGTYEFTVTYYSEDQASGNVVGEDTFSLTFTRGEQVDAGEDQAICFGDTTILTATGADTYLWSTGETTASIEVSPNNTVTYTVIGDHGSGNFTEDTVTVSVNESTDVSAGANQAICEGESVTLTATATGGEILWSNGATTNSITVSPNSTTTYTVTADNNGCASSDDVTVTVSELPSADAGNDVAVLNGESVTLTASGGGTYLWSTGETTQNIEVSPATDEVYTVTVTNASGCTDEDSVQVSVIEPIVAEAGEDSTICEGESVTLNASGGGDYLWSTGESTQSITVNPDNTTVYTVTVSDAYSSDSDTVTVTVNPVPIADAGDDVTIDQGESITLYGSGGNSYIWSTGETNANISVSPTETTTYRLTAIINGCSSEAEVTVTVLAPVNADAGEDVTICNSESVTLTASGGDVFEWSNGETSQSIEVSPVETTIYSVRVSNSLGFAIDEVQVTVNDCSLSGPTEVANGFEFKAFPNPTNGLLNLKISALDQDAIVYVTDIIGKRVRTIEVGAAVNQVTRREINLSGMPPGFYILNFSTENRSITKKIVLR